MILQPLTIARNTFVESLRQPVLLFMILISGLLQVFNTWNTGFAMGQDESAEVTGDTKLMFDLGLATVFVCGMLLAGFIATAALSREIENKTVLMVVSKPVSRAVLILGKFIGVSGAILIASVTMIMFLLMAIRHGVMSTASDELDMPVLVFSLSALALAGGVGAWGNFFYGWSFTQTTVILLLPLSIIAYLLVLLFGKEWHMQPLAADFKPQVTLACACLLLAILVLTSVAVAASTRLSQVMTIVVCVGVFLAALLSNFFIGRHVFLNRAVAIVESSRTLDNERPTFLQVGDTFEVKLEQAPSVPVKPGEPFYFSPSPNGFPMLVKPFDAAAVNADDPNTLFGPASPHGVVVTRSQGSTLTIRHIGPQGSHDEGVERVPERGDYVFLKPTKTNPVALAAWGAVPNLHFFWLLDAVTQTRAVPVSYVILACVYAGAQIVAFLSLAVILFQRRDVG